MNMRALFSSLAVAAGAMPSAVADEPHSGVRLFRGPNQAVQVEVVLEEKAGISRTKEFRSSPDAAAQPLARVSTGPGAETAAFRGTVAEADLRQLGAAVKGLGADAKLTVPVWQNRARVASRSRQVEDVLTFVRGGPELRLEAFQTVNLDRDKTWNKSLMIIDPAVVDSPRAGPGGPWNFGTAMRELAARNGQDPQVFVRRWLRHWEFPQTINFHVVAPKSGVSGLLDPGTWPHSPDGRLDLDKSPFRLLAIVHRADLRSDVLATGSGSAGENRLVFGFGSMSVIFEYGIKAASFEEVVRKSRRWHDLQHLEGEEYLKGLQDLTDTFVPAQNPEGNTLNQLRTNEIQLGGDWELREFQLSPAVGGHLAQVTIKQTPQAELGDDPAKAGLLNQWINDNARDILAEKAIVPVNLTYDQPGLAGAVFEPGPKWGAQGEPKVAVAAVRQTFALQTCNGCHNEETANGGFFHIFPRATGSPASQSAFMTGVEVTDPAGSGRKVFFSEKDRRLDDLDAMLNLPWFFQLTLPRTRMVH